MNKVFLMGRLTAEPELKFTQSGKEVLSFSLAVDSGYGEKKKLILSPVWHGRVLPSLSPSGFAKARCCWWKGRCGPENTPTKVETTAQQPRCWYHRDILPGRNQTAHRRM